MKAIKARALSITLIALCFILVTKAHADDTVTILGNESMPFNGVLNGQNAGMTYEILEEATLHGAPKFEFQLGLPWKRAQKILESSGTKPVAIVPFTRTKERENHHTWIAKLFSYQSRVSTLDNTQHLDLKAVSQEPIGIIRGSAHIPYLEQIGFDRLSVVNKAIQNALKLANGHIYGIAESQYVDTYHWKQIGRSAEVLQFIPFGESKQIYVAGNRTFPSSTAERIAQAINKMEASGKLKEILARWSE